MLTVVPFCLQLLTACYPKYVDIIKDIVTARSCDGELNCRIEGPRDHHGLVYLVSLDHNPWHLKSLTPKRRLKTLEIAIEVITEADKLAGSLSTLSDVRYFCHCRTAIESRHGVMASIFQGQLRVARLLNVRIKFQPESFHGQGMVSKDEVQEANAWALFRDNAATVMKGQVGAHCPECLQRMWEVLDALEGRYIILRQYRLRPRRGSLMDILFECPGNDIFWSLNPKSSVKRLLIDKDGVNMGETIRCKTPEHIFAFVNHMQTTSKMRCRKPKGLQELTLNLPTLCRL